MHLKSPAILFAFKKKKFKMILGSRTIFKVGGGGGEAGFRTQG